MWPQAKKLARSVPERPDSVPTRNATWVAYQVSAESSKAVSVAADGWVRRTPPSLSVRGLYAIKDAFSTTTLYRMQDRHGNVDERVPYRNAPLGDESRGHGPAAGARLAGESVDPVVARRPRESGRA